MASNVVWMLRFEPIDVFCSPFDVNPRTKPRWGGN